jgi:hypothetical protein
VNVLFLGPDGGTSQHRYHGFQRLGHCVRLLDPRSLLSPSTLLDRFQWNVHPWPLGQLVRPRVLERIGSERFDLVFVDGGSLVGPELVVDLQARGMRVVNFNHDDPYGSRDGAYFKLYRAAVRAYDMVVVVRKENVPEARELGARRVLLTYRVADEIAHAPRDMTDSLRAQWASEVAFIGTWMPGRGTFLAQLLRSGVPLSIFGNQWQRAPEWRELRKAHRRNGVTGDDYCYAIQAAKICIGLLSVENRDLHTTRSLEIPALGSLLCAQRTDEHLALYTDGEDAVFWDSAEECSALCHGLLGDVARRACIARNGQQRFLENGHSTERLLARIIDQVST